MASPSASPPGGSPSLSSLPPAVAAGLWRGSEMGQAPAAVWATGFEALDRELPGGGWPGGALTELLQPQPAVLEWRLLGPALARLAARGQRLVLVNPPRQPHAPGLLQMGLDVRQIVWVQADSPAQQLWCTEQLLRAAGAVVVAWLPQARPDQLRRLQLHAQAGGERPAFICRPAAARHEPSAAPLRLLAAPGDTPWALKVQLLKRRGPAHEGDIELLSVPGALRAVLPARAWRSTAVPTLPARRAPVAPRVAPRPVHVGAHVAAPVAGPALAHAAQAAHAAHAAQLGPTGQATHAARVAQAAQATHVTHVAHVAQVAHAAQVAHSAHVAHVAHPAHAAHIAAPVQPALAERLTALEAEHAVGRRLHARVAH